MVMVRSVLHDDGDWKVLTKKLVNGKEKLCNDRKIVDLQLFIQMRDGVCKAPEEAYHNEWISTQALHEIMLHCCRIEKMFKDGIIKRIGLSDMFREIVSLRTGECMQFLTFFLSKYFIKIKSVNFFIFYKTARQAGGTDSGGGAYTLQSRCP